LSFRYINIVIGVGVLSLLSQPSTLHTTVYNAVDKSPKRDCGICSAVESYVANVIP